MLDHTDANFLTTRWSIVINAGDSTGPEVQGQALERLCHDYWYPLYAFLRRSGHSQQDAQDLTQGFFERFLRRKDFKRAAPELGRFRSYLLTSLKNFVANEWRKDQAAKRGGGVAKLSMDADLEERYVREPADEATPESLYQRSWANSVLDHVLLRLEGEFASSGKGELFHALRDHLGGRGGDGKPYAEIAAQHELSVGAVTMAVQRMRRRYGELLRKEIAETVSTPEEIDDEIRFLMGALVA